MHSLPLGGRARGERRKRIQQLVAEKIGGGAISPPQALFELGQVFQAKGAVSFPHHAVSCHQPLLSNQTANHGCGTLKYALRFIRAIASIAAASRFPRRREPP